MAEGWDASEDGAALLAAVTAAITGERARAAGERRPLRDADLARAVLRSQALRDVNRKILDDLMAEYKPKVAAIVAAEAVAAAGRERIAVQSAGDGKEPQP